jgi:hypothetical protein
MGPRLRVSEPFFGSLEPLDRQRIISFFVVKWCAREESNLDPQLRRLL